MRQEIQGWAWLSRAVHWLPVAWIPLYGDLIRPRGCEFSFLFVSVVMGVVAGHRQGQKE